MVRSRPEAASRHSRDGHRRRDGRRHGFTLIEMLMVVVIIGLLAGFAAPRINSGGMRADAAARQMRGALQVAQRTAVTRQFDVIVGVDAAGGGLRVTEDRNNNAQVDAGERTTWHRLDGRSRFAAPPSPLPGSVATTANLSRPRTIGGLPSVIFRRNGAASSALELYLAGSDPSTTVRAVSVVQATGRTEWHRHTGAGWKKVGA